MKSIIIPNDFLIQNNRRILSKFSVQKRYRIENQIISSGFNKNKRPKNCIKKHDERYRDILNDIYYRFDVTSSQRAKDLGFSASTADQIYKYIEKEQLAESFRLNLSGKKGGLSKFHSLTKKGIKEINKSAPKQSGGTGPVHFFLQRFLKKYLPEKGFKELTIEKNFQGRRVDLFGIYDGKKTGIEICVSTTKTEYINIKKDKDKVDLIIIATPDKKTREKLVKALNEKNMIDETIRICLVHELLNDPDEVINGKI